jgi:hypothetical protein
MQRAKIVVLLENGAREVTKAVTTVHQEDPLRKNTALTDGYRALALNENVISKYRARSYRDARMSATKFGPKAPPELDIRSRYKGSAPRHVKAEARSQVDGSPELYVGVWIAENHPPLSQPGHHFRASAREIEKTNAKAHCA